MSKLYHIDQGQGDPVVLLHSGGMSHEEWLPQIPTLAKRFRVIAPDHLGHGQSPMVAERLAIGDIGRALVELLDKLDIHRAALVGSSMGGAVALWVTLNHPQRVSRLVLYRVGYRKNEHTHRGTQDMADPAYWRGVGMQGWLSKIHEPQGGPEAWQSVIKRVSQALDPATSDHAHGVEDLRRITCPTLVVVGDRDPLVPLEHALDMVRHIADSGLWVLPFASHVTATNTWRAESFALELTRFLLRK
ncbi:MAG: alpha/beta fold hydrolase [Candidatus Competibacteraceae bacterium]|nr:alpha/beta fold hydrolase [Candidatus Competibacteraceae bacterium]